METLLWIGMFAIYALCAWIWYSEFGKQFPRRRQVRTRGTAVAITFPPPVRMMISTLNVSKG